MVEQPRREHTTMSNNNALSIYVVFVVLALAIWIDSLWVKIPVSLMIAFTAWAMTRETE
jgi:hypothetical protein